MSILLVEDDVSIAIVITAALEAEGFKVIIARAGRDVPILGALFRSADYQRAQTELVIIVTPHLVTPVAGEALALPTDRIRIPTERELFLFGDVAKGPKSGAVGEVARQDFSSSYGYVME